MCRTPRAATRDLAIVKTPEFADSGALLGSPSDLAAY